MLKLAWDSLRAVLRFALVALFLASILAVMVLAWQGWVHALRAEIAASVLAFSVLIRFNLFALIGCFLYGLSVVGLPPQLAIIYLLPALAVLFPAPLIDIFHSLRAKPFD